MIRKCFRHYFSNLVLGEHNGTHLSKSTLKVLNACNKINPINHLLLCGQSLNKIISNIQNSDTKTGVQKIITAQTQHILTEQITGVIRQLITKYHYKNIIGMSSSLGKDIIPRVSGYYQMQPICDVIDIIDEKTFIRPTYAGNALSKVVTEQEINFITIRASSFQEVQIENKKFQVESITIPPAINSIFINEEKNLSNKPDLTTANVVVSGGRGLKNKENFNLVYQLADAFGNAAVGASRAAVDSGYCANQMQVGQTGKCVAPELYIAVGISGAVQHLAGMKDSKVIVAINNRPDQPIFQIATYGLQGDLFKILPQLTKKIKQLKSNN